MCCAADAQLARVHLTGPGAAAAAGYPDDTWLQIEGQIVPGSSHAEDGFIPTMSVVERDAHRQAGEHLRVLTSYRPGTMGP